MRVEDCSGSHCFFVSYKFMPTTKLIFFLLCWKMYQQNRLSLLTNTIFCAILYEEAHCMQDMKGAVI